MNTQNDDHGSMPYETDDERMAVFNAGYEYAIRNRPRHCTTKIELFKSFWFHNIRHIEMELTDEQIQYWIDNEKSIADAVYKSAHWQLDQPIYLNN